ncbi:hypothetical protein [Christiangramia sp. LLG6405-1]|uniref:hypothetical protein n=1 Tax=Christiangramia sp. LLG6405-1 TaxID=3160832 RepID=UPI00386A1F52
MYRGFNLVIPENLNKEKYFAKGLEIYKDIGKKVLERIEDIIEYDGIINGNKVISDWFPSIDAHIFLSHSHKDEEKAITLAGILYQEFGLVTFIDSCIWGNSNSLLKILDDKYCWDNAREIYIYEKRNFSTSHVHLMLSSALNKMIDNTECLLFLNTPNSINAKETVGSTTFSPWIFSEISTSQIVRKTTPKRLKPETRLYSEKIQLSESVKSQLTVEYEMELSHLNKITLNHIKSLMTNTFNSPEEALDKLYKLSPIDSKFYV